ncbi:MAG TPA: bifunctional 5,10-methylenetetrahydrofolate dehydrogenase/5,10-methenyltetrahydrofolate cyclohydrolase [Anaerovoracaceae bacterium]|nr:bifunctional 5,10-methylenetetrahydrofolate dehydrogenase/5,10-methenyltetrahydrofolate cyclohydrolase [Anaerovoracaceae bacterium]
MLLKGKEVADKINEKTIKDVEALHLQGVAPTLAIVRVGENDSDIAYEKGAEKKANLLGIKVEKYILRDNDETEEEDLVDVIKAINDNKDIHGVLLFRPLPKRFNDDTVRNTLAPEKDIDGITDLSMSGVFTDKTLGYPPCTAAAAMEILRHYGIEMSGKKAVIIGRSLVIGKPVAMMLLKENATITICNSKTPADELEKLCKDADIIIAATGRMHTVTDKHITDKQVVIDVGINFDEEGKMCGDADFADIEDKVRGITPVPGGVGSVTTSILMQHVVEAAK